MRRLVVIGVAAMVWLVSSCAIPIGDLGGPSSTAFGINEAGVIVGTSELPGSVWSNYVEHAFKRLPDGTILDLGTLPGAMRSGAAAINEQGEVAGTATFAPVWPDAAATVHLVRWDADGTIVDLGLVGSDEVTVRGIDDDGRIVGFTGDAASQWAFLYDPEVGHMTPLPLPPGATTAAAYGMNDVGDAVGYADGVPGGQPVRWDLDAGGVEDLAPVWGTGGAFDINDAGTIVGLKRYDATTSLAGLDAAILRPGATEPERLGIGEFPIPTAINNHETVVGYHPTGSSCLAFRWDPGIGRRDLAPDAVSLAWDINDRGQIVGQLDHHAAIFATPPGA